MNINSTSSKSSTDYSRITGLATGMDIDAIVKQGLSGEQSKIDKANQDVEYLKWQQEAYVDTIKDFKDFNNFFDILKPDNMMSSLTYAGVKASSDKEDILAGTALPGAVKGNYEVTVTKLAQGAKTQSDKLTTAAGGATAATKLSELGVTTGSLDITVNGKLFNVKVDETKSIGQFIDDLKNTKLPTGEVLGTYVNASFSELTNKLTIETKNTGASENLTIANANANLKLNNSVISQDAEVSIKAPGETASVSVKKSTNSFTIDNVNYNLVTTGVATLTIKSDSTATVDKFKKFIEKYNTIVEKFNTKITEKKQYNYKPLTDAQKSSMKDDEIKNWETAAKKGILRRDESITRVLSGMRTAMMSAVENAGISLSDIGISTTSDFRDGGKLKLDETKLKSALEEKGDLVQKLFTQSGTTDGTNGIFQRIKGTLDTMIGSKGTLIKKAGYTGSQWASDNDISKSLKEKNQRINDLKTKMADKQKRLYSMYATLEKNMNKLNSQSSWLASNAG